MAEFAKMVTAAQMIKSANDFIEQEDFCEVPLEELIPYFSSLKENWRMFKSSHTVQVAKFKTNEELDEQLSFYGVINRQFWRAKAALLAQIELLRKEENGLVGNQDENSTYEHFEKGVENPERSSIAQSSLQSQPIWPNFSFKSIENTWGEFDGNLTQWQGFHDRFKAAIHDNEHLSGAYKFMYLQNSLKGKASQALGEWQLTDGNYSEAWARIKQLYERKYQTSAALIRKLNGLPKLEYANGAMIQKMSNTTHEVLRQLRALEHPVEYYDLFVVHTIHDRLDAETSKAWEFFRSSETPTVQELLSFLDKQAKALSNVHYLEHKQPKEFRKRKFSDQANHLNAKQFKQERVAVHCDESNNKPFANRFKQGKITAHWIDSQKRSSATACAFCRENHPVHRCAIFLKLNLANRKKGVREHGLCNNCLKPDHIGKNCFSGPCARCDIKHNSLLCGENPANRIVSTIQTVKENKVKRQRGEQDKPKPGNGKSK